MLNNRLLIQLSEARTSSNLLSLVSCKCSCYHLVSQNLIAFSKFIFNTVHKHCIENELGETDKILKRLPLKSISHVNVVIYLVKTCVMIGLTVHYHLKDSSCLNLFAGNFFFFFGTSIELIQSIFLCPFNYLCGKSPSNK